MLAITVWVRAEMRRRVRSMIGLTAVVALGIGSALATAAGAHRASTVYDRFAQRTGAATIVMSEPDAALPTSVAVANRHLEILDQVRALPGVESVQVETWFGMYPQVVPQTNIGGSKEAFSVGYTAFDPNHPPLLLVAGTVPAPDDAEGVVVNEAAVAQLGLHVGSELDFDSAGPERFAEWSSADGRVAALDGPTVHAVVRAVGRSFQEISDPGFPDVLLMPGITAAVRDSVINCACFVHVRTSAKATDRVRSQLEALYRPYGLVARPGASASGLTDAINVERFALMIAALVAALAALFVIAELVVRTTSAMSAQGAVLGMLGLARPQRAAAVAAFVAPAVIVGAVLGVGGAYLTSGLLPRGLAHRAEPTPGLRFDVTALGWGAIAALVATGVLVALIAWRSTASTDDRRPRPATRSGRLLATRPQSLLGTSFALDPTGRRGAPALTASPFLGLALAATGLVTVTTLQYSRDHARTHHEVFGAPAAYWFDDNGAVGSGAATTAAQELPGVTAITRTVAFDDATTTATGPDGREAQVEPTSFEPLRGGAGPTVARGVMPRGPDEVALGSATARELDTGIGDTVSIVDSASAPRMFRVVGLVISWGQFDPSHAFVLEPRTLADVLCGAQPFDTCNVRVSVWAGSSDAVSTQALLDAGFIPIPPPANLGRLQQVGNIPWLLAGLLAVLGLAGLAHALTTALHRRRADLLIGRALGWTPTQSATVLFWQALVTGLVGSALGTLVGLIAGRALWQAIAHGLGIEVVPIAPMTVAAVAVVGFTAAAVLLSLVPFVAARRLRPGQLLRTG